MYNILANMETPRAIRFLRSSLRLDVRMELACAQGSFKVSYLTKNPHMRNEALAKFKLVSAYEQVLGLVEVGNLKGALEAAKVGGIHEGRITDIETLVGR